MPQLRMFKISFGKRIQQINLLFVFALVVSVWRVQGGNEGEKKNVGKNKLESESQRLETGK